MDRLSMIRQMLEQEPNDAFMLYAAGLELRKLGETLEAMDIFYGIIANQPDYLPVYYQLSEMLLQMKRTDEAIRVAHEGIALAKQQNDQKTASELAFLVEE